MTEKGDGYSMDIEIALRNIFRCSFHPCKSRANIKIALGVNKSIRKGKVLPNQVEHHGLNAGLTEML